ncbi:hypothetical protein [Pseudofrankia sp. BMG5.37]|nr:hypothetical protein [Pseudofrankia sp. BMG5.37]MDT3439822.1 hypothetical protein [Pseudofrankia sp. BMG5.37]
MTDVDLVGPDASTRLVSVIVGVVFASTYRPPRPAPSTAMRGSVRHEW